MKLTEPGGLRVVKGKFFRWVVEISDDKCRKEKSNRHVHNNTVRRSHCQNLPTDRTMTVLPTDSPTEEIRQKRAPVNSLCQYVPFTRVKIKIC